MPSSKSRKNEVKSKATRNQTRTLLVVTVAMSRQDSKFKKE